MNKILSQALKKAVSEYSPEVKQIPKDNRPDLFSLNNETELFQNDRGIIIKIDRSRDSNLTDFGRATLKDRYLGQNESFQDLFARVASTYADDNLHAQRIYNYISNLWFMPATPVLSNGRTVFLEGSISVWASTAGLLFSLEVTFDSKPISLNRSAI